jgi:NTP pyrophosphatase (non-canonical NTP hydrolase)
MEILKRALDTYGPSAQINKTIEECTELSLVLQHHRDGKATVEEVVDELADVFIMVTQMRLLFNGVDERVSFKLNRLTERMK